MNFGCGYFNTSGRLRRAGTKPDLQEALCRHRFSDSNAWSPEWPGLLATYWPPVNANISRSRSHRENRTP